MKPHAQKSTGRAPKRAATLLAWFCNPDLFDEIEGDLAEQYSHDRTRMSARRADVRLVWATLCFFRPVFLKRPNQIRINHTNAMWTSNIKVASRHLRRHALFSVINTVGLAVAIACCLLAGLYVAQETSVDQFHSRIDRTYRLGTNFSSENGGTGYNSTVDWPVGRMVRERYPQVESVVHMRMGPSKISLQSGYHFKDVFYAENTFMDVFDFPVIHGSSTGMLVDPYTAVISRSAALDLFGKEDARGELIVLEDSVAYEITGVLDVPRRSHIQFDVLLSFATFTARTPEFHNPGHWLDLNMINYVLLRQDVNKSAVAEPLSHLLDQEIGTLLTEYGYTAELVLEPLQDVYLRSERGNNLGPTGSLMYVWLIGLTGAFILVIAIINFVNLTTSRSVERAREVGVRKSVGATRSSLVHQFITEALVLTLVATIAGWMVAALFLGGFNNLSGASLVISTLWSVPFLAGMVGLWLMVGILAGVYPAVILSRHEAAAVLKGRLSTDRSGIMFRRGLVVFQFGVSIVLIVGSLVVNSQIRRMTTADLGFDREQVVVIPVGQLDAERFIQSHDVFVNDLAALSGVEAVTSTNSIPGRSGWRSKMVWPEGRDRDNGLIVEVVTVDHDYVQTMGLDIVAGRNFDRSHATDTIEGALINEAAVVEMGWGTPENAIGKTIDSPSNIHQTVVGVVADYHHHSLKEVIKPIVYAIKPWYDYVAVRGDTRQLVALAPQLERVWNTHFPGFGFSSFFLDNDFDQQYRSELIVQRVVILYTFLAILISCLGLFSLAAYSSVRRTKEIGIRRALGASITSIVGLLSREYLVLVGIALLIGIPTSFALVQTWLKTFPDPVTPGPGIFLLTALTALSVALATVLYQAVRAASASPAQSLKSV